MRRDMPKVILDTARVAPFGLRHTRRRASEDEPHRQSMAAAHRADASWKAKESRDHFAPLMRYLAKQVGRPWNSVYRDICASIDRRKVIDRHMLDHVHRAVALHGLDAPHERYNRPAFYVDRRTGLLCRNKASRRF